MKSGSEGTKSGRTKDRLALCEQRPICNFFFLRITHKTLIGELEGSGVGGGNQRRAVHKTPSNHKLIFRCTLLTVKVCDTFNFNTVMFHEH